MSRSRMQTPRDVRLATWSWIRGKLSSEQIDALMTDRGAFWEASMHMERLDSAEIGGMSRGERVEGMKAQGRIMFREVRSHGMSTV